MLEHCRIRRPRACLLENVPEMDQKSVQNEEGQWESESDWVIEQFEHMAYYAFPVLMTAQDYGSPMARIRWWLVILDIEPACAKRMGIEQHVYEILNSLKEGCAEAPYSVDNFLLDADILERLVDALPYKVRTKVNRLDEECKNTHLNFVCPTAWSGHRRSMTCAQRALVFAHLR